MEKELIFQILGINELTDERAVKNAYMEKLKGTNPEDDPEGFRRLREAYENAIKLLRTVEEETEEAEKTEIDLWIDKMDAVYQNFKTRGDVNAWKELLADGLCQNLDTSIDARNAAIHYLLSHFYLPMEVWQCLDKEFEIVADFEQLKELFPEKFLDYVKYYTENPFWVKFERFEKREGAASINVDAYIRTYLDVENLCDCQDFENAAQKFGELSAYGVWYPLEDVARMRLLEAGGNAEEALKLADRLSIECEKEESVYIADREYILPICGNVKWNAGDKEDAYILWKKVPENMDSRFGMMKYYLESEETAEKAKEIAMDIWEMDGSNQRVEQYVRRANELVLAKLERKMREAETKDEKDSISVEMAWCYYQNEDAKKAVELLEAIDPGDGIYYTYHNLMGRTLAALGRTAEAVPELRLWLSLILETVDDGSQEAKKRLRRKGTAYLMLGHCLMEEKEYDEAVEMLCCAEKENTELRDKISAMTTMAETFLAMEAFERAADKCDQIIQIEPTYYPAFLIRQEACFKMQRAQQVVDDYYAAIEIYPGFYKPYLLAAKVFFFFGQYEDAKGVIDRARNAQVQFSDDLKLWEVRILRNLAESNEDRKPALEIVEKLAEEVDQNNTDIEDVSEIDYETALLYWDNDSMDLAVQYIKKAIAQNPSRNQYLLIQGHILRDMKKFDEALKSYQAAREDYEDTVEYLHSVGCCYSGMDNKEKMIEYFEKVLVLDPNYPELNEQIADYYMDKYREDSDEANFEKAIEYINKEVAINEHCYSLVCRGLIYMDAMRLPEAIADFEKAITYQPDDWAAYNNLGCCYKYQGKYDKAIELFEKSMEVAERAGLKKPLPYSNLAKVYDILSEYEKVIDYYQKVLEIAPDRIGVYEDIGLAYCRLKDFENAIRYYEIYGEKHGGKEYLLEIADCYAEQRNMKKAKQLFEMAISDENDDLEKRYELYNDYAAEMISIFEYKQAIKRLDEIEKAVKKSGAEISTGEQAKHWRLKARAYYMLYQFAESAECAKKAKVFYLTGEASEEAYLNYGTRRPVRLGLIGECYMYMGESEKAIAMFEQISGCLRCTSCRRPKCYEGFYYMGIYYYGLKQYDKALFYYEQALEIVPTSTDFQLMVEKLRKEIK